MNYMKEIILSNYDKNTYIKIKIFKINKNYKQILNNKNNICPN